MDALLAVSIMLELLVVAVGIMLARSRGNRAGWAFALTYAIYVLYDLDRLYVTGIPKDLYSILFLIATLSALWGVWTLYSGGGKDTGRFTGSFIPMVMAVASISAIFSLSITAQSAGDGDGTELKLGAILPLTGDLVSEGRATQEALLIAQQEINSYFEKGDSGLRLTLLIEDDGSNPLGAKKAVSSLYDRGARIVIGPDTSASLEAVLDYAKEGKMLFISYASTSPALAVVDDWIFRMSPDDTNQAEATASLMKSEGISIAVPIWRGDLWGDGLIEATRRSLGNVSIQTSSGVRYDTKGFNATQAVEMLNSQVNDSLVAYGRDEVAVLLVSFDEMGQILLNASKSQSLSSVRWYGSDTNPRGLEKDPAIAEFLVKTKLSSPLFPNHETKDGLNVLHAVEERTGATASAYSLAAYDALWIAVKSCIESGSTDPTVIKGILPLVARSYYGATGWTALNDAGDRQYGSYDFWRLQKYEGEFFWYVGARYRADPQENVRLSTIEPPFKGDPKIRILAVNSYHEGMPLEMDLIYGAREGLARAGYKEGRDYELRTFWMDTKVRYIKPEEIAVRAQEAMDLIDSYKPDLVLITDDNAMRYVAVNYTLRHSGSDLPFVFSGVNADPTIFTPIQSLERPGAQITGLLERMPFKDLISLGTAFVPNASSIIFLADGSESSSLVKVEFEQLNRSHDLALNASFIQVLTFSDWKRLVLESQNRTDILGILNYYQLKDERGEIVSLHEVVGWTAENNRLPEVGLLSYVAQDGFLSAASVSYVKTGIYQGIIAASILNGKDAGDIPIVDPKVFEISLNVKRADELGIELTPQLLMQADFVYTGA